MADDQRHGRIVGVLLIITFLTSIPAYLHAPPSGNGLILGYLM